MKNSSFPADGIQFMWIFLKIFFLWNVGPKGDRRRDGNTISLIYFTSLSLLLYNLAKSLLSCLTLCDPVDGSPPGSPVPGILQAILEWVAISFSSAWKWKVKVKSLSSVRLLATPGTAAYQAPLSMGVSWQEYWSGVPLSSPLQPWELMIFGFLPSPVNVSQTSGWYTLENCAIKPTQKNRRENIKTY